MTHDANAEEADHEFGSQATELKLALVEAYLRAFTTALRGKFRELWYIDAFAGTGQRTERVPARHGGFFPEPEKIVRRRGSAKIAIDVSPPFDKLVFVEKRKKALAALRTLGKAYPNREIEIISGDANKKITALVKDVDWRDIRAVLFLDPYGMSVEWSTLKAIARTEAIDVWYLFPLSGLYRQAAQSADLIDDRKRDAITRVLGTTEWEKELYATRKTGFFGPPEVRRTANVAALEAYVKKRLEVIFPKVLSPLQLPRHRRPQMFSLFFAISNPNGPAIGLATKIASHILKSGMSSHSRPW